MPVMYAVIDSKSKLTEVFADDLCLFPSSEPDDTDSDIVDSVSETLVCIEFVCFRQERYR